jgi:serine/threonine protein kinase
MAQEMEKSDGASRSRADEDAAAFELVPESGARTRNTERFRAGDLIENRYRMLGSAATGGMGLVYVCEDTLLARSVAIKLMRSDSNPEQRLAERFFAEARITAQVQNPHVVQLFECATLGTGEPYMVMEFIDGSDLFSILRTERTIAPEKVVRYMLQVCEGLRAAHAHGIVHCDLKPENLIRTRNADGTEIIKIVDFGVAIQKGFPCMRSLTNPGLAFGSPHYMAPEQIRTPVDLDVRTDIWALGVVMFELMTGRPPFIGSDEAAICASVLNDAPPPVSSLCPGASPELEAVITLCLQKDRENRFSDVDQLMLALAHVVLRQLRAERPPAADGLPTSESVEHDVTIEAHSNDCVESLAETRASRRRYVGRSIAVATVLGALLCARSDVSRPGEEGLGRHGRHGAWLRIAHLVQRTQRTQPNSIVTVPERSVHAP